MHSEKPICTPPHLRNNTNVAKKLINMDFVSFSFFVHSKYSLSIVDKMQYILLVGMAYQECLFIMPYVIFTGCEYIIMSVRVRIRLEQSKSETYISQPDVRR